MQKKCTKCAEVKVFEDFSRSGRGPQGRESRCKVCRSEYQRLEWYPKNKKAIQERKREYSRKYCSEHKEAARLRLRKWQRDNPTRVAYHNNKRRAARLNATPPWLTAEHWDEIAEIYANCPAGYHVDHIVPLLGESVRGLHVPWNLRIIPAEENLSKGNRLL